MDATRWAPLLLTAAAAAVHLWADARGWRVARALGKGLASAGFLLLAALRLEPDRHGVLVLAGLVLSAGGDLLLLGRARRVFLAGVGAFLAAHLAYAAAFAPRSRPSLLVVALLAAAAGFTVHRLWPRLGALRVPVVAYTGAISVMLLLALGVPDWRVRLGAALFYASDLAVARDRFVAPGFRNHLVGIPLYYAGQLLLAATAGG